MKPFYRYIRPVKFNEQRLELETAPRGGICLRFEQNEDGTLWFTYARCHPDELFSKDVAKRIADNRAYAMIKGKSTCHGGQLANTQLTELLAEQIIEHCEAWRAPIGKDWMVRGLYMEHELKELGRDLELLVQSNIREKHKGSVWISGIEATRVKDQYDRLDREDKSGD
jgi:hypothetical protein